MSWVGGIFLALIVGFCAWQWRAVGTFLSLLLPSLLRKLPTALITMWCVATLVFAGTKLVGEDVMTEGRMDEATRANIMHQWGLDQPLHKQYFTQVSKLMVFDTMPSRVQQNKTMRDILRDHFRHTASLGWRALTLAVCLGIPIGVICAIFHNRFPDQAGKGMALVGVSVPSFVIASLALYFLARRWQLFPATSWTNPVYMWVPACALAAFPFASIMRLTRASMLEALHEDYVRTARAKGVAEWKVVLRHTLRNALSPVVTVLGPITAGVLTGSLVVEKIFVIPGIGDMFVKSVQNRDLPLIMGISVFYCGMLVFMNLLVDSVYPILNPRLRK